LTGYVLFSEDLTISGLYNQNPYQLFEVAIEQGKVTEISEIGNAVRARLEGRDSQEVPFLLLWQGNTDEERIANLERVWDFTGTILPRSTMLYISAFGIQTSKHISRNYAVRNRKNKTPVTGFRSYLRLA
jgi:hypothetical protein